MRTGIWDSCDNPALFGERLARLADHGFIRVVNNAVSPAHAAHFLAECNARGLHAWLPWQCVPCSAEGFLVGDDDTPAQVRAATAYVHKVQPGARTLCNRFVWGPEMVVPQFTGCRSASHLAADVYPIGRGTQPIVRTTARLRLFCGRKHTAVVNAQAFSWSQDAVDYGDPPTGQPFPTLEQMRFIRRRATLGGAQMLLWFSYYFIEKEEQLTGRDVLHEVALAAQ